MILKTYARVFTHDMAVTLPLFEQLVGCPPDIRFTFGEWEIVALGDFLLVAGTEAALAPIRDSYGPVVVDDLAATLYLLEQAGAVITTAPVEVPTGTMLYARHPGGPHVEYVQWKPELVKRIIG